MCKLSTLLTTYGQKKKSGPGARWKESGKDLEVLRIRVGQRERKGGDRIK